MALSHHSIPIAAKAIFLQTPRLGSQADEALEAGKSVDRKTDKASTLTERLTKQVRKVKGFLESPTAHHRIARNAHPCASKVVRKFDSCRNLWVDKVECKGRHPACNSVIPKHRIPKCQTVYGFRNASFVNKCSALPIDCQCAS